MLSIIAGCALVFLFVWAVLSLVCDNGKDGLIATVTTFVAIAVLAAGIVLIHHGMQVG